MQLKKGNNSAAIICHELNKKWIWSKLQIEAGVSGKSWKLHGEQGRAGQGRSARLPQPGPAAGFGARPAGLYIRMYVGSKEKADRFKTCFDSISQLYEMI